MASWPTLIAFENKQKKTKNSKIHTLKSPFILPANFTTQKPVWRTVCGNYWEVISSLELQLPELSENRTIS